MKEKIKICENHSEYQVPLIWTYAFPGAEWWCPYCGHSGGMFGTGDEVNATEKLIGRRAIYKEYSKNYLSACGLSVCAGTEIDGNKIMREKFSNNMVRENEEFLEGPGKWEHQKKTSALLGRESPDLPDFGCVKCKHFRTCDVWEYGHCEKWERKK